MFDFDVGKLLIVGIVALVVIPSKDLPRVLRQVGQAVGRMRRMATDFRSQLMDAMREADVADIKKEFEATAGIAGLDIAFDPLKDAHDQIVKAIETDPSAAPALATADPGAPTQEPAALPAGPPAPPESLDPAMDAAQPPAVGPSPEKPARKSRSKRAADADGDLAPAPAPKKRASRRKVADAPTADAPATDQDA